MKNHRYLINLSELLVPLSLSNISTSPFCHVSWTNEVTTLVTVLSTYGIPQWANISSWARLRRLKRNFVFFSLILLQVLEPIEYFCNVAFSIYHIFHLPMVTNEPSVAL